MRILVRQLAILLMLASISPAMAVDTFDSKAGSYEIDFPVSPEQTIEQDGEERLVARVVKYENVIYIVAQGDFAKSHPNPATEMEANIVNFAREANCEVNSRKAIMVERGSRKLAGIRFAFAGETLIGEGIVVVDGMSSYLAAASSIKPASKQHTVDQFLKSFHLLPR